MDGILWVQASIIRFLYRFHDSIYLTSNSFEGTMNQGQKRSYSLDPVILRMRSAKKVVRDLEKLVKLEDKIRKEVLRLGIMKHGRSGKKIT